MLYSRELNSIGSYDVVVAGGGASGICAAISASELGARVLIVDRCGTLGGNLTAGHVGPTMGKYQKNTAADKINRLIGCDTRLVQDFELAKIKISELVEKSGIDFFPNTPIVDVIKDGSHINALVLGTQNGPCTVSASVFVDASGDGVVAYLSGEEVAYGREDGRVQPATIMFTVENIDPEQTIICRHEEMDTVLRRGSYLELCRKARDKGELPPEVNIVRLYPCSVPTERMVNATQIGGINALLPSDLAKGEIELRRQMLTVLKFLQNNVEGFENARIKDSSDGIGIRESRRIVGKYVLSAEDLISGRKFEDVIVHNANFPVDIHNPNGAGQAESKGRPCEVSDYDIPYRALVPIKTDNLLLSGRCISGTHRAHASYRVMNIAMNVGEAVGIAAALSARAGVPVSELDVKSIQDELASRGVDLFS